MRGSQSHCPTTRAPIHVTTPCCEGAGRSRRFTAVDAPSISNLFNLEEIREATTYVVTCLAAPPRSSSCIAPVVEHGHWTIKKKKESRSPYSCGLIKIRMEYLTGCPYHYDDRKSINKSTETETKGRQRHCHTTVRFISRFRLQYI